MVAYGAGMSYEIESTIIFVTVKYGVPIATLIFFVFYLLYVLASIVLDDLSHPTVPLTNGYQPLSTTINDYQRLSTTILIGHPHIHDDTLTPSFVQPVHAL